MQNNILKVQENWSWPKEFFDIFTTGHFFSKFEKFASLTNKVKDIPRYTPTFCQLKLKQMIDLTCLTINKDYIKPIQRKLGAAVVT